MYMKAVGRDAIKVAHNTIGILIFWYLPTKVEIVDINGLISALVVSVNPNTKSFQIQVNWNKNAAPKADQESGKNILK